MPTCDGARQARGSSFLCILLGDHHRRGGRSSGARRTRKRGGAAAFDAHLRRGDGEALEGLADEGLRTAEIANPLGSVAARRT